MQVLCKERIVEHFVDKVVDFFASFNKSFNFFRLKTEPFIQFLPVPEFVV